MCIVATVCLIGADTNLNNISVTHIAVRYIAARLIVFESGITLIVVAHTERVSTGREPPRPGPPGDRTAASPRRHGPSIAPSTVCPPTLLRRPPFRPQDHDTPSVFVLRLCLLHRPTQRRLHDSQPAGLQPQPRVHTYCVSGGE